ncbi:MAG: trehalose-phosphatase [Acidobacteria bacterium 13_1_40CM_2_68_10]|nr:MAG: trehalose-phosphatase [Acidobacteria bacterium 13_1_40CM_2_68_10]OLE66351.1 MAG: trehalose-phosphatase [Acidobacteria bacterium 13_1_20CM_2_68_14]
MARTPEEIVRLLPADRGLLLFLDYDGTLVPFHDDPSRAVPGPELLALLNRLTTHPRRRVVIVSGRSADDLRRLLPGSACHLLALHGAQYVDPEGRCLDRVDLAPCRARLKTVAEGCRALLASVPCVRIEDKGAAIAIHMRSCDHESEERATRIFEGFSREVTDDGNLTILRGSRVVELKPAAADKGSGALWLLERFGPAWYPVYVGDDTTDEDGFRVLRDRGATIRVGPTDRRTLARWRLADPAAVLELLARIVSGS